METLFRLLLTNAALAGLIALAAWVASRFVRRQAVVHTLWLLALVKLVTPPLVELPLLPARSEVPAGQVLATPVRSDVPSDGTVAVRRPLASLDRYLPEGPARRAAAERPEPLPVLTEGPSALSRLAAPARRLALPMVLVLGAVVVVAFAALRFARFRRLVSCAENAPPEIYARAAELSARLGVRRVLPIDLIPAFIPPMLWPASSGPRLLLPRDLLPALTGEERDALLAHELAHVRRRDHWVRFLELAATALFWWYPVTWWARRALRRAEERCCDEWVLRALPDSAHAYANGILKSLTFIADAPVVVPCAASGAGPIEDLEARLKEILMTHPLPRLSKPIRFVLGATAIASLALFPTVAPRSTAEAAAVLVQPETDATLSPEAPTAQAPAPPSPAPALPASPAAPAPAPPALAPSMPSWPAPVAATLPPTATFPAGTVHFRLAGMDEERDPALEAERHVLDDQRRQLQRSQMELERRSLELEARVQQKELAGEAARLKAEGDADGAARVEKRGALNARRVDLERRRLDLQMRQIGLDTELERAAGEDEAGGTPQAMADRRHNVERMAQDVEKKSQALEAEVEQLDRQMQALDAETRVHELRGSTEELAKSLAAQIASLREELPEAGAQRAELEREVNRLDAALGALKGGATKSKSARPPAPAAK